MQAVSAALRAAGLSNIIDTTGTTIGKRYARTDEIGVPFAVTIDGTTLEDGTATIRERDSTAQVRESLQCRVVIQLYCSLLSHRLLRNRTKVTKMVFELDKAFDASGVS